MSEPIAFPRGGLAGIRYRTLLMDVVHLVIDEYGTEDRVRQVLKHLAHDLGNLDQLPWSGILET